jgi:hypothetical protein
MVRTAVNPFPTFTFTSSVGDTWIGLQAKIKNSHRTAGFFA